ncbi:54S ribosomal protein IMG2, mitochondrial [Wickerhamiella sorbophila]|uniref:Large ribosomal subunit protein mL49 n=1 Tax=Wickerhamiella sorbophila TaxID=45607 RepID=A0A2T0FE87_9ASCO|nr:54S ribosomal protein IMG2, mitochondrial [Wickerhamiella sorbophila]PRT53295.1 54S ribosomal protein IMG2, mitochondrial [Wickerhamiella sorbophila]
MIRGVRYLHIPRGVKAVPIPQTARTTPEIKKYVEATGSPKPSPAVKSQYVKSMMPETVDAAALDDTQEPVWYSIERTRAGNLPVYTDYNNAGGVWTEIRKISGNVSALRNDIKKQLDLPKKDIWIQDASKRIIIKGNHSQAVKQLLGTAF